MNTELNPLTLGDIPEEYIENSDGSVDIIDVAAVLSAGDEVPFAENLVEVFDHSELNRLGSELVELVEKDKESRKKRDKQYEEGLRRTGLGEDAPGGAEFEGSSRVVHPVLAEGCVDFASRAIKELFPAAGPVKTYIAGETTPQKLERAERKKRFMNWQLTTQISEYRSELEQLLTQMPMGGSQYQKIWPDNRLGRPRSEFVPIDEIFLPYAASNFYTAQRVTHRQLITRFELEERIASGLYSDLQLEQAPGFVEQSAAAQANDKIEGREDDAYNEDGLRAVLEIHTWRQFPNDDRTDGAYAPYIITVDEYTEKVLSVYRNWDEEDTLRRKLDWIVEWRFIPWRGAYAIGLPHLIGGLSAAMTGALRALLDSAHINNAATMLKMKGGRIVGQNTQVNVTQVCDIEGPAGIDDIRKLAMPMPFNPPSAVLAGLLDQLYGLAKGVIATTEDQVSQVGDRTPVGTTMALIETGSTTYSAIHARLHESQKKALEILHRINAKFMDEARVAQEFGEELVTREDFAGSQDVIPVSDPTIFSEAQRFAQVQALTQMSQDQTVPWNKLNIYRRALKQMRIEAIDELLPPERNPVTADVLTENMKALDGFPLKAEEEQDHMSHIQAHLGFVASPVQLQNPLVPPQALQAVLAHVQQHMQMFQARVVEEAAQTLAMSSFGVEQDKILLAAMQNTAQPLQEALAPFMQQIGQIQQALQTRMPQPPLPPEVQASIQIATQDIQRKTQYDQAMIGIKQQEAQVNAQTQQAQFQSKMQLEQAQLQLDQMREQFQQQMHTARQQFDTYIRQAELAQRSEIEALRAQVDLANNRLDNQQKQETEIQKNDDDNETKLIIEGIRAEQQKPVAPNQQT